MKEGLMTFSTIRMLLVSGAAVALTGSAGAAQPMAGMAPAGDPIASAQSAAPAAISWEATIVTRADKGVMTTLRKGTNGWTCMPDAPDTPGPDPMCFDANAGKWAEA